MIKKTSRTLHREKVEVRIRIKPRYWMHTYQLIRTNSWRWVWSGQNRDYPAVASFIETLVCYKVHQLSWCTRNSVIAVYIIRHTVASIRSGIWNWYISKNLLQYRVLTTASQETTFKINFNLLIIGKELKKEPTRMLQFWMTVLVRIFFCNVKLQVTPRLIIK